METELCKKRIIYLSKGYHLIRIYLSQFCFKVGGGGGYIFYYVVSFVKRCALHGKLNFSFSGMKCFVNKMNFGVVSKYIKIKMRYYLISFRFLVV